MTTLHKLCLVAYVLALAMWLAALVAAAVGAINVFGNLPGMDLTLADFEAYPADEHGRLAAGLVMEDVFFTVDLLQFAAVPVVILTLLAQLTVFRHRWRRLSNLVRAFALLGGAALFGFYAFTLAPGMNRELRAFRADAAAGDIEAAAAHRAAFQTDHRTADGILKLNLLLVLAGLGASAAALTPTAREPT